MVRSESVRMIGLSSGRSCGRDGRDGSPGCGGRDFGVCFAAGFHSGCSPCPACCLPVDERWRLGTNSKMGSTMCGSILADLQEDTSLDAGMAAPEGAAPPQKISKKQAVADIAALSAAIAAPESAEVAGTRDAVAGILRKLSKSPSLLRSPKQESFLRSVLDLIEGKLRPFCATEWNPGKLRSHISGKLSEASAGHQPRSRRALSREPRKGSQVKRRHPENRFCRSRSDPPGRSTAAIPQRSRRYSCNS